MFSIYPLGKWGSAPSVTSDWVSLHRPVISRKDGTHTLYSGYNILKPNGHPVECHGRKYLSPDIQAKKIIITCMEKGCRATCTVSRERPNQRTPLGGKGLVKVDFPAKRANVQWILLSVNSTNSLEPAKSKQGKKSKGKQPASSTILTALASMKVTDPAPPPTIHTSTAVPTVSPAISTPQLIPTGPVIQPPIPNHQPSPTIQRIPSDSNDPQPLVIFPGVLPALEPPRRSIRSTASLSRLTMPPPDSPSPTPSPSTRLPGIIPPLQPLPTVIAPLQPPVLIHRSNSTPERHPNTQPSPSTCNKRPNEANSPPSKQSSTKRVKRGTGGGGTR